jgi:DNA-binding GntR family transcriptional regulator
VPPRLPLRAQVRLAILGLLEEGALPPDRVRDTALAERLGVSRTPVREALLELVRGGVLLNAHGRGFRVAPLDPGEIREQGQMLGTLAALALRIAPSPTEAGLEGLEAAAAAIDAARGDLRAILDRNEAWHEALLADCPNRRLRARVAELRGSTRRYVLAYLRGAGRVALATGGHRRIVAALRTGDQAAAARVLEEWLVSGSDELAAWLTRGAGQADGGSRSSGSR